jgi:Flp pilus assembly protein TadD
MGEIIPIRLTGVPIRRNGKPAAGKRMLRLTRIGKVILGRSSRVFRRSSPFKRAKALDEQGKPAAAQAYRKAIAVKDRPADAWCKLGILESRNGQKSKAMTCFQEALALKPKHTAAHFNLANHFYDSGNFREAEVHYRMVTEAKPSCLDAYWNLAQLQLLQQRYGEAMALLERYQLAAKGEQAERAKTLMSRVRRSVAMDGT